MTDHRADVLVIGGGPAGAAAGFWLAKAGHDVVVVERKTYPREKTCGDGLTPRAVHQLDEMGLGPALEQYHRYRGLRTIAHGITLELPWPDHPRYPSHGYVVRRRDLDRMVAEHAAGAGARLWQGAEAMAPLVRNGIVAGATIARKGGDRSTVPGDADRVDVEARYVLVADGANSRIGRALGTSRNRAFPQGMAIRGYFASPRHDDPWIESVLDVRDRQGASLPGYGWVFPVGDGCINVGIGLLSTFRDWKSVNTSRLMEEWAATAPAHWGIADLEPLAPPTGGRLPMAGSVSPKVGPAWLAAGDAAGSVNPFNGEGIDYAYETARAAAGFLDEALRSGDGLALQGYQRWLDAEYGLYFKVARAFAKVIGRPALMRELTRVGFQSESLMSWVLRIMANLLRDDERGPAEVAYRAVATLARVVPEPAAR